MPLIAGQVEPFHHRAKKGTKGAGAIFSGAVLVKDTALTPDGWKIAPTSGAVKPFGFLIGANLVGGDAATGDTNISVVTEGEVNVIADGAIEPNSYVQPSGTTAGQVIVWDGAAETNKVGLYLGDKSGTGAVEAAADGDVIRIIKEAD
jgi:hypothetical protein